MGNPIPDRIWNEKDPLEGGVKNGLAGLPRGYQGGAVRCVKCGSNNISGALITPTADQADPNILCLNCGYWWD